MSNKKIAVFSLIVLGLLVPLALAQTVQAVRFSLPSSGGVYGDGGVGVVHVKIDTDANNIPDTWIETYCISEDDWIYGGQSYDATLTSAPNTATNRAVAFILTWWHMPGTYTGTTTPGYQPATGFTTTRATAIQNAIWKFTDAQTVSGTAATIANDANGKDVVNASDTLTLEKVSQTENTATLKATLTSIEGPGHANVMIIFALTGCTTPDLTTPSQWNLPAGYTHAGITDNNGEIEFTITFTEDAPLIKVDAYTQGLWPNILDPNGGYQNLAPVTYGSSLVVKTTFFVVPEYVLGGLLALAACFAAFAVYKNRATIFKPKL